MNFITIAEKRYKRQSCKTEQRAVSSATGQHYTIHH